MAEVDHRPDLRLAAGLGVTLLVTVMGPVLWAWSVRDRLPDEVARHWSASGQVTGTWSLTTQLWVMGAITLVVAGVMGAVAVLSRQPVTVRRSLTGCAVWTATLLGATQVDALRGQLDLIDGSAAPAPGVGLAFGAAGGLVLGVLVAALASEPPHRATAPGPPAADLPRLPAEHPAGTAGADARPSFVATSPLSRGLLTLTVVLGAAFTVPAAFGLWWLGVLGLTTLAPVIALSRFTTRVDEQGLHVTAAGVTLVHVPLAQVVGADVIEHLDAFWEFGGWGLRVDVHGRTGVVGRSGPALEVRRADGSDVIVTLTDARLAAATLNTLADRHHEAPTPPG